MGICWPKEVDPMILLAEVCNRIVEELLSERFDTYVVDTSDASLGAGSTIPPTINLVGEGFGISLFFSESDRSEMTAQHGIKPCEIEIFIWYQLIESLVHVVPIENPMGLKIIQYLLSDSSLPIEESVLFVADMITRSPRHTLREGRNICVILGCLADRLNGNGDVDVLLIKTTLEYLFKNLDEGNYPDIMLFSFIALDKFAQKIDSKPTRRLPMYSEKLLARLEWHSGSKDVVLRQLGFYAKWCLDNFFVIEGRNYTCENVMLNTEDVSEYLKISADGLEVRCDINSFESVRCTYQVTEVVEYGELAKTRTPSGEPLAYYTERSVLFIMAQQVSSGCWYYECMVVTPGVMQIGWTTRDDPNYLKNKGRGIGDDQYSISFDGCRCLVWYNYKSEPCELPTWTGGSILGCLLDLDAREVIFSLNGIEGGVLKHLFEIEGNGFYAAASLMSFQQCRFNFGTEPFRYPPKKRAFNRFSKHAALKSRDKIALPGHSFLEEIREDPLEGNSC